MTAKAKPRARKSAAARKQPPAKTSDGSSQAAYLAALHETTVGLMGRLEVSELLEEILKRAAALAGTEHGYIYLLEPGQAAMHIRVAVGWHKQTVGTATTKGHGVGGKVWETGHPVIVQNYETWPDKLPWPEDRPMPRDMPQAIAGFPLQSSGEVVGVFAVSYFDPSLKFADEKVEVLSRFAALASVALDNARLYAALRGSESELRALFSAMTDVVLVLDSDGYYRKIAPTNPRLLIRPLEDMVGKRMHEILPVAEADSFVQHIRRCLAEKSNIRLEYNLLVSGEDLWFEATVSPLTADTVVWLAHDITARKQGERELQAAKDAAEAASRAKSTFLANMSHELRTPLNHILGYSEMMIEDAREAGQTASVADLEKIHTAGARLLTMISDIIDISKMEAGRIEIKPEPLAVADVVNHVQAAIRPLMEKNGNTLAVDCPPDAGHITSDPARLRQVLLNLLDNAAKFTDHGTVTLAVKPAADKVSFVVADTGAGLPPEQLEHLFQPFMQIDPSSTRKHGGTGLGLAISKKLCDMLGGDIEARSAHGQGATFTVTLPRTTPARAAASQ